MSVETLRKAASLMRERATRGSLAAPWTADVRQDGRAWVRAANPPYDLSMHGFGDDAEHIASWHPAVALAVAKAMDDVADAWEICDDGWTRDMDDDAIRFEDTVDGGWLNVARAYLGDRDA